VNNLADKFGIPWKVLAKTNKLEAPYLLQVGQVLLVPAPKTEPKEEIKEETTEKSEQELREEIQNEVQKEIAKEVTEEIKEEPKKKGRKKKIETELEPAADQIIKNETMAMEMENR
jgi:LysM repeat protein